MYAELIDNFRFLPDDLIYKIFNYTDVVVYRYGKLLNRIDKNDYRYKMIQKIPRPVRLSQNRYLLKMLDMKETTKPGYLIEYIIGFHVKINVRYVSYETDGFDKYIETKTFCQYIFDIDNNWSKLIRYTM